MHNQGSHWKNSFRVSTLRKKEKDTTKQLPKVTRTFKQREWQEEEAYTHTCSQRSDKKTHQKEPGSSTLHREYLSILYKVEYTNEGQKEKLTLK